MDAPEYAELLKKRSKESRVYQKHQMIGLELAQILEDNSHKSLYIKLAKSHGEQELISLAKRVAENKSIKNKGAYFMKILHNSH